MSPTTGCVTLQYRPTQGLERKIRAVEGVRLITLSANSSSFHLQHESNEVPNLYLKYIMDNKHSRLKRKW